MIYVYYLSFNGIIFYIGTTKSITNRAKQHVKDCCSVNSVFLKIFDIFLIRPDITIVGQYPKEQAIRVERMYIRLMVRNNIKITNTAHNPFENRLNILKKEHGKFSTNRYYCMDHTAGTGK